ITEPFSRTTITPALKLPLWVVELSLAVGMTLFFIRAVEMTIRALRTPATELDKDVLAEEAAAVGIDVEDIAIVEDGSDRANRADRANGGDRLGDGGTGEKGGDR